MPERQLDLMARRAFGTIVRHDRIFGRPDHHYQMLSDGYCRPSGEGHIVAFCFKTVDWFG
jgi:hypothetical protein